MSDATEVKAGTYELVAVRWDEILSKPGEPFDFVRHHQGDLVDLNAEEARRLFTAGAVVEPGAREKAVIAATRAAYEAALAALGPEPEAAPTAEAKPLDEQTLAELRDYASEHGIDLGGASRKEDVLAAITKAEQA